VRFPDIPYDSPYNFSFSQKIALTFLPSIIAIALKSLFSTCKWEVTNIECVHRIINTEKRIIIAIWHEHMAFGAHLFQGTNYHTLTSYSYDGELASRIVRRFGIEAVRGSSSRGGSDALNGLQKALEYTGCVGWTMDGPKGPRRIAKPGIAVLSARTRTPIVPMGAVINKAWHLNSWDSFPVPKPFAQIHVEFGEPIAPPDNESNEKIEQKRKEVETALNNLIRRLEGKTNIEIEG